MYLTPVRRDIMAATSMIHVRVNEQIKAQATETLAAMGLSVSDAVRVLLARVAAGQQLPFAIKVPNTETRAAMAEAAALQLTYRERAHLAERLLMSLEDDDEIQTAWAEEIALRITQIDSKEIQTVPSEKIMAQLRAQLA
jgi:DNA-damage-inducible protein J